LFSEILVAAHRNLQREL